MRGFPFGTFSSFNSLSSGSMTGPSAEREAPHANSPVAIEYCSIASIMHAQCLRYSHSKRFAFVLE